MFVVNNNIIWVPTYYNYQTYLHVGIGNDFILVLKYNKHNIYIIWVLYGTLQF